MRVVFLGSLRLGLVSLRAAIETGHDVVLVVTHDGPSHERGNAPPSVMALAGSHGIPALHCPGRMSDDIERRIIDAGADIVLSANWRRIIDPPVLGSAHHGGINVHRSLLPRYGGLDPLHWAIVNGETETGVTIHAIEERLDLGDIILQRRIPIGGEETATDVHRKSLPVVAAMVSEALQRLDSGTATKTPQDAAKATMFPQRRESDLRIDWTLSPRRVHDLIRAQSDPFPNAFTHVGDRRLRIKEASLATSPVRGTPGHVAARAPGAVLVRCGVDGSDTGEGVAIRVVQEDGGEPIGAPEYFERTGALLGRA